jgi:hypothetical protein
LCFQNTQVKLSRTAPSIIDVDAEPDNDGGVEAEPQARIFIDLTGDEDDEDDVGMPGLYMDTPQGSATAPNQEDTGSDVECNREDLDDDMDGSFSGSTFPTSQEEGDKSAMEENIDMDDIIVLD